MSERETLTSQMNSPVSISDIHRLRRIEKRKDLHALFTSLSWIAACEYVKLWHRKNTTLLYFHQCRRLFRLQRKIHVDKNGEGLY